VYLLRDGRDVMVSNLHFRANLEGRNFDLLRMVRDGEGLYPCRWHEHVDAWMVNPYGTDLLIIRYEDLLTDCLQELRRFCAFMGEDRDDEFLERVVQNASVDNMRKNEQQFGWSHRPTWPADKSFIRRAQSGSYRDEMPLEIQALFEEQAGKTLRECGYLSSADDALARS
jgi:hypothetical protein